MSGSERDAWVQRVLAVTPPQRSSPPATADGTLKARLVAAIKAVDELKAEGGPELPPLFAALKTAREALDGPAGAARLDEVEALLAQARSAARTRQARAANVRGIGYPKLLLRWRDAQRDARAAVAELGRTLLAIPEVQRDPRLARAQKAVADLPRLIPDLGEQLGDLLDEGINAGTDAGIARDALAVVAQYRQRLAAATQLNRLEAFARRHVGELAVLSTLDGALAEIAINLTAAT